MVVSVALAAHAQADQAISTHNYKHPNKARLAAARPEHVIVVADTSSEDALTSHVSGTPRYRLRKPQLIFARKWKILKGLRPPFNSSAHYKTGGRKE